MSYDTGSVSITVDDRFDDRLTMLPTTTKAGLPDRPRPGHLRKGGDRLGQRIRALLQTPKAGTTARIWKALGRPKLGMSTMRRPDSPA
jgi:hypothetical protein